MKSYVFGLLANYVSLIIGLLITLILVPFLLKKVGAELTGVYFILMTVSNFVAVGIGWLAGTGVKLIAAADATEGGLTAQEVHWVVFLGFAAYATIVLILTFIASLGAGNWWLVSASQSSVRQGQVACILLGVFIWVSYIHNADLSLFTATLRQGQANMYRALSQLIFGLVALAFMTWKPRIDLLMLAQVIGVFVVAVIARLHLRSVGLLGRFRWRKPDSELVRQMFITVGGPFFIFGIAQFVLLYADTFVIGTVMGAASVAHYIVVWKIAEFTGLLLGRISETLSPYLTRVEAKGDFSELREIFLTTSRLQHWLGLTAGFGYAIFAPYVIMVWVGAEQRPEQWWLYPLSGAALALQVVNRHDVILHFALGRVGRLLKLHIIEVILKLVLTLLLFPLLWIGAPIAAFVIIQVLGVTWWYRRAGLRLVCADWSNWRGQVGCPAAIMLILLLSFSSLVSQHVMKWGFIAVVSVSVLYLLTAMLTAFWHERRREIVSISALPAILSKI